MSQVAVSARGLAMRQPNSFGNTSIKAERIFLLSPANIGGIRGSGLMSGLMRSDLATRLQTKGAPLGEIFSFVSGLYFRGKLAYSQKFAKVTDGVRPVYVITASAGLIPYETVVTLDRLLEICRVAKERLNPNSRRILLGLGEYEAAIPVDDFYARCAAPIDRTIEVVDSLITKVGGLETLSCIYIVGGGSEFPPVARALRTRFGRRVRKSSYAHAATAIGLAITTDMRSEITIERTFTRNFGVWREAESGATACFDTLFPKGCRMPAHNVRRYHPTHNIGHFRYLECDEIDESDRPAGDIAPWDDILFPFEPQLCETATTTPIRSSNPAASPLVEEVYACDENGIVQVTIRNLTADYDCVYALRR